jgi:hypothetical protein
MDGPMQGRFWFLVQGGANNREKSDEFPKKFDRPQKSPIERIHPPYLLQIAPFTDYH